MVGLVLGSGAARGYAHIGALKVLEEQNIRPDMIAGCSIGAVIGAIYASYLSAEKLEEIALSLSTTDLISLVLPARPSQAILNSKKIADFLSRIIPAENFEDLEIPLKVVATSLNKGTLRVFESGPLLPAVLASISIPIIFPAVKIGNEYFVDGGVISPLPVEVLKKSFPDARIIAVNLVESDRTKLKMSLKKNPSIYLTALLSVVIMQIELTHKEKDLADIVIEPDLGEFEFFEFHRQKEIIEAGERAARKALIDFKF
jgi:NTE family protein